MANIYAMVDTWNDSGTTFTGIGLNVTDTASDANSLLMDLQVGGASKFSVDKGGLSNVASGIRVVNNIGGIYSANILTLGALSYSAAPVAAVSGVGLRITNNLTIGFSSGNAGVTPDLFLRRDAANTLAQRNGTNAQAFNLYNTYTDASNYERGFMKWNSNVLEIGTEADGTGSARGISMYATTIILDGPGDGAYILKRAGAQHISAGSAGPRFSKPPYASGSVDLGLGEIPWRDIYLKPSSSLTPTSNGDLCIEATDNTTLTFKYKGSDGVVRSGTVALS